MTRHPKLSESLRLSRGPLLGRATRRALGLSVTGKRLSRRVRSTRRGSTLLVVVALLGMLSLLGLLFFTFATQEQANATFFAEAAKRIDSPSDDIDAIFEDALKQLIQGADIAKPNSVVVYQHSLLGTMLGKDLQPFSGTASNFTYINGANGTMELVVDQNGDGAINTLTGDFNSKTDVITQPNNYLLNPLEPNGSAAAQPDLRQRPFALLPAPDVDYTYPDIANMFLAQKMFVWDKDPGTGIVHRKLVLKPSFHRPELLRDNDGVPIPTWATHKAGVLASAPFSGRGRLLRPHPEHLYVWRQNTTLTPERRFLDDYNATDAALIAGLSCQRGFPFNKVPPLPGTVPAVPVLRRQGVWSQTVADKGIYPEIAYEYDADNDGDQRAEGIWMDLDLGVLVRPSDNKTYVPLISFTVYDLDSLINLNTSGNLSGEDITKTNPTVNFGTTSDVTRSAMGLGPNEVNPSHALDAVPGAVLAPGVDVAATSLTDHNSYFGHVPTNQRELANMEFWWMLTGRVEYTTPNKITAGRHGEANRLWNVLSVAAGGPAIGVNVTQSDLFPFAGYTYADEANKTGGDDNRDENEGRESWLGVSAVGQTQPFVHPLLLQGRGRFWGAAGANFKKLDLRTGGLVGNPSRWLGYVGAGIGYDTQNPSATPNASWVGLLGGNLMTSTLFGANYKNVDPSLGANEHLVHDELETTLEPKDPKYRDYDEPLSTIESLWLQMGNGHRTRAGIESRLSKLLPGNLQGSATATYQFEISQRFTTESWDLKTFGLPRLIGGMGGVGGVGAGGVGVDNFPGIKNVDDNGDGVVDDSGELGWPGSDDDRAWEYNVDFDGDRNLEFPPQFNPTVDFQPLVLNPPPSPMPPVQSPTYRPENAFGPRDPFRPQLRRLLSAEYGDTKEIRRPTRLSINEFLDVERRQGVAGNDYTSPLQYRALTPHSTDTTVTTLPTTTVVTPGRPFEPIYTLPTYPPTSEAQKEFWARRDRQQMARDIYVMLYTFCGGNDMINATANAGNNVHTINVRRQMAQFAVNVVDALDRDNCITKFEYDNDLSNGWGLDDDASGPPAYDVATSPERDVVFGVEAQELTISETLWLYQDTLTGTGDPQPLTPFNETAGRHNFVQIELRSIAPYPVSLASTVSTTANTGIWRIHRDDNADFNVDATENVLTFLNGAGTLNPSVNTLFTVASSDSTSYGTACLYIDTAGAASDFEIVAPNKPTAPLVPPALPTSTPADLDVLFAAHAGRFALKNGSGGDFLSRNNNPGPPTGTPNSTTFRLERRMNPSMPNMSPDINPGDNRGPNPFVAVDVARGVQGRDLAFDPAPAMSPPTAVVTQANAISRLSMTGAFATPILQSEERREPLDGNNIANCTVSGGPSSHLNTIGQNNSNSPGQFNLFQTHFDRDFASTIELFEIPLRGPNFLTRSIVNARRPASLAPNLGQLERGGPFTFGGAVLLQSEDVDQSGGMPAVSDDTNNNGTQDVGETDSNGIPGFDFGEDINMNGVLDSHPYHFQRLLSMVEVPTRTHRQFGNPLQVKRVPGKMNLNNIRDRHVLAALIDDREAITTEEDTNRDQLISGAEELNLPPDGVLGLAEADVAGNDPSRDWWKSFLESRERIDPATGLPLPITGLSRPFRDLANLSTRGGTPCIEDTILRRLPDSTTHTSVAGRGLFELASEAEFTAPQIANQIDPVIRRRLLSKIMGNTTTRSNCFVVFATIGMFECVELPNGAVRIGGQMDVDKDGTPDAHRAIFIIDRSEALDAYDQGSGTFDWKKLIKARQRIN